MSIFKSYDKPKIVKKIRIVPNTPEISKVFKQKTGMIIKNLLETAPQNIQKDFSKIGFHKMIQGKIYPHMVSLKYQEEKETGSRFIPHVVEPSFGLERLFYAILEYSYRKKKDRVIMALPRELVPAELAVFPLVNKDGLYEIAKNIYETLLREGFFVFFDDKGSIGRRYARADEAGIPLGITVDYSTKKDDSITLRDQVTWEQIRVKIQDLPSKIREKLTVN
jgi:glycyl-tRNA synthetase